MKVSTPSPSRSSAQLTVCLCAALVLSGGCIQTSTPPIRAVANQLSQDVDAYRQQQQDRLDQLNAEYRAGFDRLMDAAELLYHEQAHQRFEQTTQGRADLLVTSWPQVTLPDAMRSAFSDDVTGERKAIADAEAAIDAARNNYADAWKEVTIDMSQLKTVKSKLDALAVPEDQARVTADFVVTVAQVYQKLRDADQQKTSGDAKSSTNGNGNGQP